MRSGAGEGVVLGSHGRRNGENWLRLRLEIALDSSASCVRREIYYICGGPARLRRPAVAWLAVEMLGSEFL